MVYLIERREPWTIECAHAAHRSVRQLSICLSTSANSCCANLSVATPPNALALGGGGGNDGLLNGGGGGATPEVGWSVVVGLRGGDEMAEVVGGGELAWVTGVVVAGVVE